MKEGLAARLLYLLIPLECLPFPMCHFELGIFSEGASIYDVCNEGAGEGGVSPKEDVIRADA